MIPTALEMLFRAYHLVLEAVTSFLLLAIVFGVLAIIIRRRRAIGDFQRALPQMALNFKLALFDAVCVIPSLALLGGVVFTAAKNLGVVVIAPNVWSAMPIWLVVFVSIVVGDFTGYWRHRLQHCPALWPGHAIHHSDTEMTWTTITRFHPFDRVSTYFVDNMVLLLLGVPVIGIIANSLVRHYYGAFIHANLSWSYGRIGRIFVSPNMHRWHHAKTSEAHNANYATVFAIWDQLFGTYYAPGPCHLPLGVEDRIAPHLIGQLTYPIKARAYRHTE